MNFIIILIIIKCTMIIPYEFVSLVVTKQEIKSLGIYYSKLQKYAKDNPNLEDTSFNRTVPLYCHLLRKASVFELGRSEDETPAELIANIESFQLGEELFQKEMEQKNFTLETEFRIGDFNQALHIPSFKCSDFHGLMSLFVTPAFIPHSAFLFAYHSNFNSIAKREIHGSASTTPILVATVDELGDFNTGDSVQEFRRLAEDASFLDSKLLCYLDRFLQSRICTISLESVIYPSSYLRPSELPLMHYNVSRFQYRMPKSYKYFWSKNVEDHCPSVEIQHLRLSTKMLRCSIYSYSSREHFVYFLKLNIENNSRIWLHSDILTPGFLVQLEIPMLKYLKQYREALPDNTQ